MTHLYNVHLNDFISELQVLQVTLRDSLMSESDYLRFFSSLQLQTVIQTYLFPIEFY
jgi:hypothetical protein